jgi:hypothetical protein
MCQLRQLTGTVPVMMTAARLAYAALQALHQ